MSAELDLAAQPVAISGFDDAVPFEALVGFAVVVDGRGRCGR
jgi:hypothetical protein